MAIHKVTYNLPDIELGKADIVFSVDGNGEKIGTLTISKGAIEWTPKNWKGRKGYKTKHSWADFDKLMKGAYKGRV